MRRNLNLSPDSILHFMQRGGLYEVVDNALPSDVRCVGTQSANGYIVLQVESAQWDADTPQPLPDPTFRSVSLPVLAQEVARLKDQLDALTKDYAALLDDRNHTALLASARGAEILRLEGELARRDAPEFPDRPIADLPANTATVGRAKRSK